jgi:hypothetical protein
MTEHTEVQIIRQGGRPAFVVVPYEDWQRLTGKPVEDALLPHEVVVLMSSKGMSPIAAWRTFRGYTQEDLGQRMGGLSQSHVAQLEASARPQKKTLANAAAALGISVEQLSV